MQLTKILKKDRQSIFLYVLVGLWLAAIIFYASRQPIPFGEDWEKYFYKALQEVFHGRTPYNIIGFRNPPWVLIPLLPLGLLPPLVGAAVMAAAGFIAYIWVAKKLGADAISITALLLSPFLYYDLQFGNINWLVMLGLVLPPQIGLFFVLAKPQMGIAIAIFWLYQAWKTKGVREVIRVFAPVTAALLLSFIIFGFWPLRSMEQLFIPANTSLWPASIPIGLVLLVLALQKLDFHIALIASPFLSPYVIIYSWVVSLYGLLKNRILLLVAVLGSWIWILLSGQVH